MAQSAGQADEDAQTMHLAYIETVPGLGYGLTVTTRYGT